VVPKANRKAGAEVWSEYGLVPSKRRDRSEARVRGKVVSREHRFRQALEDRGGLFAIFGQFLTGRADLLPISYIAELRGIKRASHGESAELLARETGDKLSDFHLIRVAPCAEVYGATYENRGIVVELYPLAGGALLGPPWDEFQREIRVLNDAPESPVTRGPAIESFRLWLQLQADVARKRTVLGNLRDVPGSIMCHFPALTASLQSPRCLAYEAAGGRPLEDDLRIRPNPANASLQSLMEALLEQSLLLSVVDADLLIENYLWNNGGIGFRAVPALSPVPIEWHAEFLQYVVCVITGETRRAIQMLAHMSAGPSPSVAERLLLRAFAGLQPELKVKASTSGMVSSFETYWRTYAASGMVLAPFLELFHRQMAMLDQWHADISASSDVTTESLWAVMGRILRFHVSQNLTLEKTKGWVVGSGLLAMASARQLASSLTHVRDVDDTAILDPEGDVEHGAAIGLRAAAIVGTAVALALFAILVSQAIGAATPLTKFLFSAAILIFAAVVSLLISRID
jgi:predicted unusual protein kinase regulating ubiquinone biosynthesis (AarF/ABC1/UbiB family)